MGLNFEYQDGQTPLDEDEKEGLLIPFITTKSELDELEQRNIQRAILWTISRRKKLTATEILSEKFLVDLHKRMLGDVWRWAGTFRKTNKNIGIDKYQVGMALKVLLDDCQFWIDNKVYDADEVAIRFKHRIVSIHCFTNGNGRHSRLMADIIAEKLFGREVFSWGMKNLGKHPAGTERQTYLTAVREADKGNYVPLIEFARS